MNDRLVLFLTHRSAASSAGDTVAIVLPCDPGGLVKNRTGESHQIMAKRMKERLWERTPTAAQWLDQVR